jgi:hypothetical protein
MGRVDAGEVWTRAAAPGGPHRAAGARRGRVTPCGRPGWASRGGLGSLASAQPWPECRRGCTSQKRPWHRAGLEARPSPRTRRARRGHPAHCLREQPPVPVVTANQSWRFERRGAIPIAAGRSPSKGDRPFWSLYGMGGIEAPKKVLEMPLIQGTQMSPNLNSCGPSDAAVDADFRSSGKVR